MEFIVFKEFLHKQIFYFLLIRD